MLGTRARECQRRFDVQESRGVLLEILGGGVPPGSPNSDPISDQKCNFPHPFSDQAPVVQKLDSAVQRINLYPVDSAIGFPNTYPLDRDLSGG